MRTFDLALRMDLLYLVCAWWLLIPFLHDEVVNRVLA